MLAQALERLDRVAGEQQLFHLVEQARRRDVMDQGRELGDRRRGFLFDGEAELCREPRGAQHPHRILAESRDGIADQANPPGLDVGDAADIVPDFLRRRVEVKRVDREVAPQRILRL